MTNLILRPSVWCAFALVAQTFVSNNGPYKLTGNTTLNYVATAHAYDASNGRIYSSTRGGIYQFDTATMRVIGRTTNVNGAGSLSLDASRNELYVLALHSDVMRVIDLSTRKVVRTFEAPAWFNVFYEEGRGELYYMRGDTKDVRVADRETGKTLSTFTLGGKPSFLIGDAPRKRLLVRLADKPVIQVIDTTDHSVTAEWPARADGPTAMAMSADGSRVFTTAGRDLVMLDGMSGKELSRVAVGDATYSMVYDAEAKYVVALSGPSRANIISITGDEMKLVQSLDTRSLIHELFLDAKTHRVLALNRYQDEGLMQDTTAPMSQTVDGSSILATSTLLTLSLRK